MPHRLALAIALLGLLSFGSVAAAESIPVWTPPITFQCPAITNVQIPVPPMAVEITAIGGSIWTSGAPLASYANIQWWHDGGVQVHVLEKWFVDVRQLLGREKDNFHTMRPRTWEKGVGHKINSQNDLVWINAFCGGTATPGQLGVVEAWVEFRIGP
jgi:hypothetical protein